MGYKDNDLFQNPIEPVQNYKADDRGRITLGSEYSGKKVKAVVLRVMTDKECPECGEDLVESPIFLGRRTCMECDYFEKVDEE